MSFSTDAVRQLDIALADDDVGQDIRLQRLTGTQNIPFEVKCRAVVRGYAPEELVNGITQHGNSQSDRNRSEGLARPADFC